MTSPTCCAPTPLARKDSRSRVASFEATESKSPPEVCGSKSRFLTSSGTPGRKLHAAADEFQVSLQTTGKKTFLRELARFRQKLDLRGVDGEAHLAAHRHFPRVAEQAEARDVRGGMHFQRQG